jgi:hypothetical protein
MTKAKQKDPKEEKDLESMILDYGKDKYKLVKTGVRWACEIKQRENLPDPISSLIPRAVQEILSGVVSVDEIEKLPDLPHSATGQPLSTLPARSERNGKTE